MSHFKSSWPYFARGTAHSLDIKRTTLLTALVFKCKQTESGRRYLKEREDLLPLRCIRSIKEMRGKRYGIILVDETRVSVNHEPSKEWVSGSSEGRQTSLGKGQHLIILHAGGDTEGLLPECQCFDVYSPRWQELPLPFRNECRQFWRLAWKSSSTLPSKFHAYFYGPCFLPL